MLAWARNFFCDAFNSGRGCRLKCGEQALHDLEGFAGREDNVFEPLGGAHRGVRWAKWPGRREEYMGAKELRFVRESAVFAQRSREFSWPVVEDGARELWVGDGSRCVEAGLYETRLVSVGSAPQWEMWEVEMVHEAFSKRGVQVHASTCMWRGFIPAEFGV